MNEWAVSQPSEQLISVLGGQYRAQVGALSREPDTQRTCQQLQVMVAQNADDSIVELLGPTKNVQGARSAVDQVTHQPKAVS